MRKLQTEICVCRSFGKVRNSLNLIPTSPVPTAQGFLIPWQWLTTEVNGLTGTCSWLNISAAEHLESYCAFLRFNGHLRLKVFKTLLHHCKTTLTDAVPGSSMCFSTKVLATKQSPPQPHTISQTCWARSAAGVNLHSSMDFSGGLAIDCS